MDRGRLFVLLLVISLITLYLLKDYITVVFSSFILSYLFYPLHVRTRKMLGNRTSAFLISVLILLIIILFFAYFFSNVFVFLKKIPRIQKEIPEINLTYIKDIEEIIYERILSEGTKFITYIPKFFINLFILLMLTYYTLSDGEKLISFLKKTLPKEYGSLFIDVTSKILKAILYGHFLTAILQGIISVIVYVFSGTPYSLFFGILTFVVSFIGITPAIVYIPVSIILFLLGNILGGVLVLLVGIFLVSTIDNVIKPHFASKFYDLHPAVFLLGMLGGFSVFGFSGTFIGPIAFGMLKAVMISYRGLEDDKAKG